MLDILTLPLTAPKDKWLAANILILIFNDNITVQKFRVCEIYIFLSFWSEYFMLTKAKFIC